VSEGLELGDEPAGFPVRVQAAGEVVSAEFEVLAFLLGRVSSARTRSRG